MNELHLFAGCKSCESAIQPGRVFCSYACRGLWQTKSAMRACAVCGTGFLPKRPSYRCCGRICGTTLRLQNRPNDPMVKMRQRLAMFCCSAIARCMRNKSDKTAVLLGYSVENLRAHLERHFESGMSWENYGKRAGQWSIDHTRPISTFAQDASVSEINALANLRPMWHVMNCAKRNKWEGH